MALNVFRQSPGRLVSSDLIPKSSSDAGYLVAQAFFEGLNNYTLSIGQASFALNGQALGLLASRYLSMAIGSGGSGWAYGSADSSISGLFVTSQDLPSTGSFPIAIGDTVHVLVNAAFNGHVTSITDTAGNTYLPDYLATQNNNRELTVYSCLSATNASSTNIITINYNTIIANCQAYYIKSTGVLNFNAGVEGTSSGSASVSNSSGLTTTVANCLLIAFASEEDPGDTWGTLSGWTQRVIDANNVGVIYTKVVSAIITGSTITINGIQTAYSKRMVYLAYEVSSGGGSPTYAINGQSITFIKGFQMPISNGTYNLTGNNLTLVAARKLALALGNYLLNGQTVTLRKAVTITLSHGSYTITGYDVQLLRSLMLTMGRGNYAINGQLLAFLRSLKLTMVQGSFALNGQAVALKRALMLALSQGSFVINGYSVGIVTTGSLSMGQGSFALNGQDLLLKRAKILAMAKGQFTLTGQSVTLVTQRKITIVNGNYIINGQPILLKIGHNLSLNQGQFNLSGYNLNLAIGRLLTAAKADFNITGNALNFKRELVVTITQGSYIVNGQDVNLVFIDVQYGGTLYQCVSGVLVLSDLPNTYNNKVVAGKKLWYIKDGVKRLIHTATF